MLSVFDDYSRMMWTYMLKNKDEALEAFKKVQTLVEKEAENKIKIFRTDRGANLSQRISQSIVTRKALHDTSLHPTLPNKMG